MKKVKYHAQHTYYAKNKEKVLKQIRDRRNKRNQLGLCRDCPLPRVTQIFCEKHRLRHSMGMMKSNYGLTKDEYDKLGKKCMVCGVGRGKKRLSVDHNHKTNKIRGLLCDNCNNGLGRFKDSVELLLKAIKYLKNI